MKLVLNFGWLRAKLSAPCPRLGIAVRFIGVLRSVTSLFPHSFPVCLLLLALFPSSEAFGAGNWLKCGYSAPDSVGFMLLLSDGTVMALNFPTSTSGSVGTDWYRLTPDPDGHYVNGEWSRIASMHYQRHAFGSVVLPDGRVLVVGGEHPVGGAGEASAEIYDPLGNFWALVNPPSSLMDGTKNSPDYGGSVPNKAQGFIDCNTALLPDGTVLTAPVAPSVINGTLIYNPNANSWTNGPPTGLLQSETSWLKLPDGSILTVDPGANTTERYIPSLNQWIPDRSVPVNLWGFLPAPYVAETGPAFLLPNGNGFFLGGSGKTAIYIPSGSTNLGTWLPGPDIPDGRVSADAPAAMMPNGKILCAVSGPPLSTLDGDGNPQFTTPTSFYEYDYSAGTIGSFTRVNAPTGTVDDIRSQDCSMLVLPDGSVLYCHVKQADAFYSDFGSHLYVYVPADGVPVTVGKPHIARITPNPDGSFHLAGDGFTGISGGAAFGDDAQMDSNYPIIQFKDMLNGHVDYGRTFHWSRNGVRLGSAPETVEFTLPPGLIPQPYEVSISVNGILSDPVIFSFVTPEFVAICPGESTTLKLITPPDRNLTYQWLFNGEFILGETNAQLNIVSAKTNQTGNYQLLWAYINDLVTSPPVPVAVGTWIVQQPPITNSAILCQPYSTNVHVRGKGTVSAQWFRNGRPMVPDSRVSFTSQPGDPGETLFSINISQTKYEDDATYTVTIKDDCGEVSTQPFTLRVVPNPPWVRIATEGPPPRHDASMCFDSDRQVTVLFGGATPAPGAAGFLGDTWEFDGTNWTQRLPVTSPSGRYQANMVYDSIRHRVVLFGGEHYDRSYGSRFSPETWEWDGTNWNLVTTAHLPPWREWLYPYTACYDSNRKEMLLFGFLSDPLWAYDGTDWSVRNPGGKGPGYSESAHLAFDSNRGVAVLAGGVGGSLSQYPVLPLWEWDGTVWQEREQSGQQPWLYVGGAAMTYDTFRQECVVFGQVRGEVDGRETTSHFPSPDSDRYIWRWNGLQWQADPPTPTIGVASEIFHSMCFDSARNALVLFGGQDTGNFIATNFTYEILYKDSPEVLKQPTVESLVLGSPGQIEVLAAGAPPIRYQWQKEGADLADSIHLGGTLTDTLQIGNVGTGDAGIYRLVLSNLCGVTISQPIQLRVTTMDLSLEGSGDHFNIVWSDPAATLQTATNPKGPWTIVPAAISPYLVVPNTSRGFFRLVR